ncbi:restriction endonuclease [Kitasatospora sp. DSM 101779]|uniref:restriction endonuclease n=1 Tax=Kitasatospora sp. DSM 101779 TaxID=2853165 RepID=UPI0021DA57EA|nr:restriction endonuclease [Kitasatospora sp. DSM 101779]MCU7822435.1 restriction endonuclease [Kitasatospora sp. DSM 101779]
MLAEAQRQQHRREEAQRRADAAAQRQYERARREAERAAAQGQREALRAYRQSREADAARRTAELEERVAALRGTLAAGLRGRPFSPADLAAPAAAFDPGQLGVPVPMPDQSWYLIPPLTGAQAFDPAARRTWDEQAAQARARFEQDWYAAQAAEQERQRRLAEYRAEFDAWLASRQQLAARAGQLVAGLRSEAPEAVEEYFETALGWRDDWPEGFPHTAEAVWDAGARQLVVEWPLPDSSVVPAVARHRYVKADDRDAEVARPAGERRTLYREVVAQCALRVLAEAFRADDGELLSSVVVHGVVEAVDPATGREESRCLVSVAAERAGFLALDLERVAAVDCLVEALDGRLSARPDKPEAVRPHATGSPSAAAAAPEGDEGPDLFTMDPIAFEELIAELFRRRGLHTRTTARSGDEGVDVLAEDPDPITGGRIVIQAKRYRHTVPPTAVRDLDATMARCGANRGILVTTSGFGPGSRRWVEGRPLTLVDGPMLVALLREHGLAGRLGPDGAAGRGTRRQAAPPAPTVLAPGQNAVLPESALGALTVRFSSAGADADLTLLLLTAEGRVRSDGDFVFYHQRSAAGGAVQLGEKAAADGRRTESAVLRPADLPADVHRVAVSVNMDADTALTCAGLIDADLLLHAADGTAWSFRPPSDPAVSAMLVAEVYRHRPAGGAEVWKVRAVGQGWADGLAGLARAHGVDVG